MKSITTLLIIFAILLLLLTLLAAFGGSLRYNEPFFNVISDKNNKKWPKSTFATRIGGDENEYFSNKQNSKKAPFIQENKNKQVSTFVNTIPQNSATKNMIMPTTTTPATINKKVASVTAPAAAISGSHFTNQVNSATSTTQNLLPGFNIEPFEADNHASVPASY